MDFPDSPLCRAGFAHPSWEASQETSRQRSSDMLQVLLKATRHAVLWEAMEIQIQHSYTVHIFAHMMVSISPDTLAAISSLCLIASSL